MTQLADSSFQWTLRGVSNFEVKPQAMALRHDSGNGNSIPRIPATEVATFDDQFVGLSRVADI